MQSLQDLGTIIRHTAVRLDQRQGLRATRDIDLRDIDARRWLAARGVHATSSEVGARVFADELWMDDFVLRRFWTSPLGVSAAIVAPADLAVVSVIADGEIAAEPSPPGSSLGPGSVFSLGPGDRASVSAVGAVAIIQVFSPPARVFASTSTRFDATIGAEKEPMTQPFTALTSAVFAAGIDPQAPGFSYLRIALEATATAALRSGVRDAEISSRAEQRVFNEGMSFIESNYHVANLGSEMVAAHVGVSLKHLQRAFRSARTTPMRELRGVRASHARALLASRDGGGGLSPEEIARRSGFNSARVMYLALRADHSRG